MPKRRAKRQVDEPILLTQTEVCAMLCISAKKLQLLRKHGEIQFYVFGHRTIRFLIEDVDQLLLTHSHQPTKEQSARSEISE
jgi:excisionase family DNA binding protein